MQHSDGKTFTEAFLCATDTHRSRTHVKMTLTEDLCPLMSLLTYQSLPCELSRRLMAMAFEPLPTANFVPAHKVVIAGNDVEERVFEA